MELYPVRLLPHPTLQLSEDKEKYSYRIKTLQLFKEIFLSLRGFRASYLRLFLEKTHKKGKTVVIFMI